MSGPQGILHLMKSLLLLNTETIFAGGFPFVFFVLCI